MWGWMSVALLVLLCFATGPAPAQQITGGTMDLEIFFNSGYSTGGGLPVTTSVAALAVPIVPFGTPGGGLGMPPTTLNDPMSIGDATGNGAFRVIYGMSPGGREAIRPQLHNMSSLVQNNPAGTGVAARMEFRFDGQLTLNGAGGDIILPMLLEFDGVLGVLAGSYVQFDGESVLDATAFGGTGPVSSPLGGTGLIGPGAGPATGAGRIDASVVGAGAAFGPWLVGNFGPFGVIPGIGGAPAGAPVGATVPAGVMNADFQGWLALEVLNDGSPTGITTYPVNLIPEPASFGLLLASALLMIRRRV
jgi:hypothetical protein